MNTFCKVAGEKVVDAVSGLDFRVRIEKEGLVESLLALCVQRPLLHHLPYVAEPCKLTSLVSCRAFGGLACRVQGAGCRVQGAGFRVKGAGSRIHEVGRGVEVAKESRV